MRSISTTLQGYLNSSAVVLATICSITRTDGVFIGLTSWPDPITYLGQHYTPTTGLNPTSLKQSAGGSVDHLEVQGFIASDAITDVDLEGGRYDYCEIALMFLNPLDLSAGHGILMRGNLGQVTINEADYSTEIRSLTQRLGQEYGPQTSPRCRVLQLGDAQCKVDMTTRRHNSTVSLFGADPMLVYCQSSLATGSFSYGKITFQSGLNMGLSREIKTHINQGSAGAATVATNTPVAQNSCSSVILADAGVGDYNSTVDSNGDSVPGSWVIIDPSAHVYATSTPPPSAYTATVRSGCNVTIPYDDPVDYAATICMDNAPLGNGYTAYYFTRKTGKGYRGTFSLVAANTLGGNTGLLVLTQEFPFMIGIGDLVLLEEGCDRTPQRCRGGFNNLINIHCEPYLPGNDAYMQTGRPPG